MNSVMFTLRRIAIAGIQAVMASDRMPMALLSLRLSRRLLGQTPYKNSPRRLTYMVTFLCHAFLEKRQLNGGPIMAGDRISFAEKWVMAGGDGFE